MGKFAEVYDIVGGEQMLVCIVSPPGAPPHFQVSTEINDVQVSITMPVVNDPAAVENMTYEQVKLLAVSYISEMTIENLLEIRRMMVVELKKQQSPAYLRKVADEQIAFENKPKD